MSLLKAAGLIAILSLISKFIGLIRDMVLAAYCGLSTVTDAYNVAYLLPGSFALLMLGGLNGPFHSAIVSTLTRHFKEKDTQTTRLVLTTTLILTVLVMGTISVLGAWFAPEIVQAQTLWKLPPETLQLASLQLRIMFPMFLLSGLIGISYGVLSIRQNFFFPSLSPIMASLAIIVALIAFPHRQAEALAWGTLAGAVLQLLLQLLPLLRVPVLPIYFQPSHPTVQTLIAILVPAMLSSTVGQVNILIIQIFASSLEAGNIAAFSFGNRVIQLPLGILLTALLVPLLPALTAAAAEGQDHQSLIGRLNQGLRAVLLIALPVTLVLVLFGRQFIALLFERGAFTPRDTLLTYTVLLFLAISIPTYAIRDLLIRVFYALQNSRLPFYTTFVSIAAMLLFSWWLVGPLKVGGIALAGSIATTLNFLVLSLLLYQQIGNWVTPQTWRNLWHIMIALVPVTGAGLLLQWNLPFLAGQWSLSVPFLKPEWPQAFVLGLGCSLLGLLYYLMLILQKDIEILRLRNSMLHYLQRKFSKGNN